jgi:putative membrane protein
MTNDPGIFFAAERTLLAWIRTGVTTIGLGFVVARFGLFLHVVAPDPQDAPNGLSADLGVYLGIALVLLGAVCCAAAAVQFTRYRRGLSAAELPRRYSAIPSIVLALGLSVVGVILAIYLLG